MRHLRDFQEMTRSQRVEASIAARKLFHQLTSTIHYHNVTVRGAEFNLCPQYSGTDAQAITETATDCLDPSNQRHGFEPFVYQTPDLTNLNEIWSSLRLGIQS
jgi:hypothetical protein